jgi:hypothetical protein
LAYNKEAKVMKQFKKLKLLTSPAEIGTAQLDDLEYDMTPMKEGKIDQMRVRRWHRLRNETSHMGV